MDLQGQFNLHTSNTRSGLGLYIAKGIVEQHGGTLTAQSEGVGKGSTFTLLLPLHQVPKCHHPRITSVKEKLPMTQDFEISSALGSLNILIVDDSTPTRKLLRRLLEKRGHTCDEAQDGQECIKKVLEAKENGVYYDCILLDDQMPVMNGPEALLKLREMGCDSFTVGITGNALPEDTAYFRSCGATGIIVKPVDIDALESLLIEYDVTSNDNNSPQKIHNIARVNIEDTNPTPRVVGAIKAFDQVDEAAA